MRGVMVQNLTILKNLKRIERLYATCGFPIEALLYSKLGVIELCGWVEESMDRIVIDMARRGLSSQVHRDHIEKDIVRKTYGFEYEKHFRKMLMAVIGLKGVQDMEAYVDPALFGPMCGALTTLKPNRDTYSHTYLKGATAFIDAPSISIQRCRTIRAGLQNIEDALLVIC